ncbi:hypothetical protein ACO0QE_002124 [Hanseniaspora vineae]
MSLRNRTVEFQRSVATQVRVNKLSTGSNAYKPVEGPSNGNTPVLNKSEFSLKASGIAHEIASTAQLLGKLATLCKKKPMINDNPVEIAELSFVIKRKIYAIEQEMMNLKQNSSQQAQSGGASAPRQGEMKQHNSNVMNLLSTKMKNISGNFKTVLEQRQKLEIANKDRLMKLTTSSQSHTPSAVNGASNGYNAHPGASGLELENNNVYNNSNPFLSSAVTVNGEYDSSSSHKESGQLNVPSEQQMMLLEQEGATSQAYMQERNRAVETIESTIQEVGSLFQQLAHMVQEQGEQIQRIDENVQDIDLNIEGAQAELMKYFDRISNNRWMAAKIFAVLFAFFLIWVLVN